METCLQSISERPIVSCPYPSVILSPVHIRASYCLQSISEQLTHLCLILIYNYADDNTLAGFFSKTHSNLIGVLEEEAGVALNWLKQSQTIACPEKFHAILIKKDQTNLSGEDLNIKNEQIKSKETVKLLGIYRDYKLNCE